MIMGKSYVWKKCWRQTPENGLITFQAQWNPAFKTIHQNWSNTFTLRFQKYNLKSFRKGGLEKKDVCMYMCPAVCARASGCVCVCVMKWEYPCVFVSTLGSYEGAINHLLLLSSEWTLCVIFRLSQKCPFQPRWCPIAITHHAFNCTYPFFSRFSEGESDVAVSAGGGGAGWFLGSCRVQVHNNFGTAKGRKTTNKQWNVNQRQLLPVWPDWKQQQQNTRTKG